MTTITILQNIQPYTKYIILFGFIIYVITSMWFCVRFFKDEKLRRWMLSSLSNDNIFEKGGSGKAFTAFLLSHVVAFSSVIAVVHSKDHELPDYMFIGLISFIAALYGIKMAGKFGNSGSISSTTTSTQSTTIEEIKEKKDEDVIPQAG